VKSILDSNPDVSGGDLTSDPRDDARKPVPTQDEDLENRARRVLVHASGFRQSPYADVKPAGEDPRKPAPAPSKLWHSSPNSSGW
jgi:hypothetical protein